MIRLRSLSVRQELEVGRSWQKLLPELLGQGLALEDAVALGYNAAFLYFALELEPAVKKPGDLLERFSVAQIARLCEEYAAARDGLERLEMISPAAAGDEEVSP